MKKIPGWLIGMLAVVGVVGYVAFTHEGTPALYDKEEEPATETEVVETPDWMQDADAVAAAEAVVKRKALEAESAQIGEQIKQLDAERAELKAKQVELDKQIGTF
jgi:hypothetical protein